MKDRQVSAPLLLNPLAAQFADAALDAQDRLQCCGTGQYHQAGIHQLQLLVQPWKAAFDFCARGFVALRRPALDHIGDVEAVAVVEPGFPRASPAVVRPAP